MMPPLPSVIQNAAPALALQGKNLAEKIVILSVEPVLALRGKNLFL